MINKKEVFISVDIETAGPIPVEYSLLSIGACEVDSPDRSFTCMLKPTTMNFDAKAMEISGLSLEMLAIEGLEPIIAMQMFRDWVVKTAGNNGIPVFTGFNASFDWAFVNYYFHHYLGANPFGFSALDIKSMYMGAIGCNWAQTRSSMIASELHPKLIGDHNSLHDAQYQAELFRLIRNLRQNSSNS